MNLHEFLDCNYGEDGDKVLHEMLADGAEIDEVAGPGKETPLHVATRRYRTPAVEILLDHGADIDAKNGAGKTSYAHAIRRRFNDLAEVLEQRGAGTHLNEADQFAVAIVNGQIDKARQILAENPRAARTGNPEEDRLLADVAGRSPTEPVVLLIEAGADLTAGALDGGTALHQAAWFGQPQNARLLIDAGAPLDVFDPTHQSSPLGWAVHGARYSGGAAERPAVYIELVRMLLDAGSSLHYPDDPDGDAYLKRLLEDAPSGVEKLLRVQN